MSLTSNIFLLPRPKHPITNKVYICKMVYLKNVILLIFFVFFFGRYNGCRIIISHSDNCVQNTRWWSKWRSCYDCSGCCSCSWWNIITKFLVYVGQPAYEMFEFICQIDRRRNTNFISRLCHIKKNQLVVYRFWRFALCAGLEAGDDVAEPNWPVANAVAPPINSIWMCEMNIIKWTCVNKSIFVKVI